MHSEAASMPDKSTECIGAPPLTEILRYRAWNVVEIHNRIMFNFYPGLPHMWSLNFQVGRSSNLGSKQTTPKRQQKHWSVPNFSHKIATAIPVPGGPGLSSLIVQTHSPESIAEMESLTSHTHCRKIETVSLATCITYTTSAYLL